MMRSIRMRLTLVYAGLVGAALVASGVGVLWLHARWSRAQFDSELGTIAATLSHVMDEELGESGDLRRAAAETRTSVDIPDRTTAILDVDGTPVTGHWRGFEYSAGPFTTHATAHTGLATMVEGGRSWRVLARRVSSTAGDYVVFVAASLEPIERQQTLLLRVLMTATPLVVLVTAAICWWVASSALAPVTTMADEAEVITAESAERRLNAAGRVDELGQLARAFNGLLDRLSTALQTQRQFMADASHELRTPVSIIHTAAEVTLDRGDRDPHEYREALTIIDEQSDRLARIVQDMLVLARADAGGVQLMVRPLDFDELVGDCVKAMSLLAGTRQMTLKSHLEAGVSAVGDEGLLRRLVTNLLDNAVRHCHAGGIVTVTLTGGATVCLTVADTGPGIPPADRDKVFERFVRLDHARSQALGAGLGLPIARWIAEQHGGTLTVDDNPGGGSVFTVRLPPAGAAALQTA